MSKRKPRPKAPEYLNYWDKITWRRLWKQSFYIIPRMNPQERAQGILTAFPGYPQHCLITGRSLVDVDSEDLL